MRNLVTITLCVLLSGCFYSENPLRIRGLQPAQLKFGTYQKTYGGRDSFDKEKIFVRANKIGFNLSDMHEYKAYTAESEPNNIILQIDKPRGLNGALFIPIKKDHKHWPTFGLASKSKEGLHRFHLDSSTRTLYTADEVFDEELVPYQLNDTYNLFRLSRIRIVRFIRDLIKSNWSADSFKFPYFEYADVQDVILRIKNNCHKDIIVAINHDTPGKKPPYYLEDEVGMGWSTVKAGETIDRKLFKANITSIHTIAQSTDGKLMWGKNHGTTKPDGIATMKVRPKDFSYIGEWPYSDDPIYVTGSVYSIRPDELTNYNGFPSRTISYGCN